MTNISIAQKITRAFIAGAIVLVLANWLIFRLSILFTENKVSSHRLILVSEHYFDYYEQGGSGTRHLNPLLSSYDDYSAMPAKIKQEVSADWLGVTDFHFEDDDSEYVLIAKKLGQNTYYLLESTALSEWSDDAFLLLEMSVLLGGFLLLMFASIYIKQTAEKIAQPFSQLANQLANDEAKDFDKLPNDTASTTELEKTVEAINIYRESIAQSIAREQSFTRYVSHELRTPMTVVKGALSLLKRQKNAQVDKQCARIDRAIEEMHSLTNTFLLLARDTVESEQHLTIDYAFIEQAIEDIEPHINNNECQVDVQIQEPFQLAIEATLFNALFKNLMINALNCSQQGQIAVFLNHEKLQIIDNGIGLESEIRGYQGFGIGLVIVQDICQRYGWTFELTNNQSDGCTALVCFHP